MKSLLFLILFVALFYSTTFAQRYSPIIADEEINDFLQSQAKHEISSNIVRWKLEEVYLEDSILQKIETSEKHKLYAKIGNYGAVPNLAKYFTSEDFKFIKAQITALNDTTWDIGLVSKEGKRQKKSKSEYYAYSIPLFSQNRKIALMKTKYFCGNLCGWSCLEAYQKDENGTWVNMGCFEKTMY